MVYPISKIVEDWRALHGLNPTSRALEEFADVETLTLRQFIEARIEEAVRSVELTAPLPTLEGLKTVEDAGIVLRNAVGEISLPDDFLRLCSLRLSGWEVTITEVSPTHRFPRQHSEFAGVRGNAHRPFCRIERRSHGNILLCLPASPGAEIEELSYLPKRSVHSDAIFISTPLYSQVLTNIPPPSP